MSQHFLLLPAAWTLSLAGIMRMPDSDAFDTFKQIRFAANGGKPFCPHCGTLKIYTLAEMPIRCKRVGWVERGAKPILFWAATGWVSLGQPSLHISLCLGAERDNYSIVLRGLDPCIHVSVFAAGRRGWPEQIRP
jgi:hypothetical protein